MQQCKTVTLRTRKCKNGMLSYYLDYYPAFRDKETMQTVRHESLHIYIYEKPKNNIERALNRNLTEKAETIRCMRYESIVNERFGLYDKAHKKESFLAYFKKLCAKNNQKWDYVYLHFYDYVNGKCTFEEVDVPLCKGFCEYLLDEAVNRRTKEPLSQNSVSGYWSTFRGMLRIAYRDKQIPDNINEFLDKVKTVESPKEVLTLEELYRLYTTPSENELIKRAALFSCLTGLRFSDVQALQWKNVCTYSDGGKYLDFISIKKKKKNLVPINKDVEKLMGKPGTGFVFKGLKYVMTQQPMKDWLADAKIQKHITFRIEGKIFLCLWLGGGKHDIKGNTEPRFALKLTPERNEELREQFSAVTPAWHWNKKHWSDVYYELLDNSLVTAWIKESYDLVVSKLPKAVRCKYQ